MPQMDTFLPYLAIGHQAISNNSDGSGRSHIASHAN